MTPRQRKFVDEYVIDQNPIEAYKRAGYRGVGRSAQSASSRILNDPEVRSAIDVILFRRNEEIEQNLAERQSFAEASKDRLEQVAGSNVPPPVMEAAICLNADSLLREMAMLAFSDIDTIIDFSGEAPALRPANQIPAYAKKAISSIKVKRYKDGSGQSARDVEIIEFKLWDKGQAQERLMRALGMGREKSPIEDLLRVIASINPEYAVAARRLLIERYHQRNAGEIAPVSDG